MHGEGSTSAGPEKHKFHPRLNSWASTVCYLSCHTTHVCCQTLQGLGSQGHSGVRPLLTGVPLPGDTKLPCAGREGTEPTPCGTCRVSCHGKGGHTWVEGEPSSWANVCRHPTHLLSSRLLVCGCHPQGFCLFFILAVILHPGDAQCPCRTQERLDSGTGL